MSFCTRCGTKLGDNAKFCSGCGTPLGGSRPAPAAPAPVQAQPPVQVQPPPGTGAADDGQVLMKHTFFNTDFHIIEPGDTVLSAHDAFKNQKKYTNAGAAAGAAVLGALLVDGLTAAQWSIRAEYLKSKICFIRLNIMSMPTASRIELPVSEIVSVEKTNRFTLMDKTEITVGTKSWGSFVFVAPKKKRDEAAALLLKLAGLQQ
ncbi:MAG: zinc ribbon domain-containing protein [Treponema sp.]|jgi:hypothetical protein|nr:zinc ribbon domain-containing protein [Treponema sp.]